MAKMLDYAQYAQAARVDPALVPQNTQRLMFCCATSPRGFERLQQPPLSLTRYAAGRLVHKVIARRHEESATAVYESHRQNNKTPDRISIAGLDTLRAVFARSGVVADDLDAAVSVSLWHPQAYEVVDATCNPYPVLRTILIREIEYSRTAAWLAAAASEQ
jgi:hypothetical protein